MREVSDISLLLTYFLVLFFIGMVLWKRLGIAKDTFWSSIRGTVQLIAVGYAINWIFKVENTLILISILSGMSLIATYVVWAKNKTVKKIFWLIALSTFASVFTTMGFLVLFEAIEWSGRFVIPIGGMLIGQAMNSATLFLNRLFSDIRSQFQMIESNLSLGARPHQAIQTLVKEALVADSLPVLNMLKTLGLIYLPGMMAGLIIAGTDPIIAVKYQLVIIFMIVFAFGVSSMILALLIHRFIFNRELQLTIGVKLS